MGWLYDPPFTERDTNFWSAGLKVKWTVKQWLAITPAFVYERGLAEGRNDLQTDLDVSHRLYYVSLGAELRLAQPLRLNLIYNFRYREWTSDLAGNVELGRKDQIHQGTAELRYIATEALNLTLGFTETRQSSTRTSRSFNSSILSR